MDLVAFTNPILKSAGKFVKHNQPAGDSFLCVPHEADFTRSEAKPGGSARIVYLCK
jgi:hypothetical protein